MYVLVPTDAHGTLDKHMQALHKHSCHECMLWYIATLHPTLQTTCNYELNLREHYKVIMCIFYVRIKSMSWNSIF